MARIARTARDDAITTKLDALVGYIEDTPDPPRDRCLPGVQSAVA
jgi:hypothetical protein